MYLDELPILSHTAGRGKPGLHGKLGWNGIHVRVDGNKYDRSIGTHAPSSMVFDIDGRYDLFTCQVALNDSAFGHKVYPTATFQVLADGVVAAAASNVHTSKPRNLIANIQDAKHLELRVSSPSPEYCHSVWLEPKVDRWPKEGLLDAERTLPEGPDLWWAAYRYAQAVEDSETSERCLRRILQVDPAGIPPRLALAKELLQTDRIAEAEPILCTLCDAGVAEAAFYLGVNNVRHGDLAAALRWMERAQQLNPEHEPTREQVANLRKAIGG